MVTLTLTGVLYSCSTHGENRSMGQKFSVGEPEVVLTEENRQAKGIHWMDTGLFGLNDQGQWKWFCGEGRAGQTIGAGLKENPFDSIFIKGLFIEGIPDSHRDLVPWSEISNWASSHWISNVYLDPNTGHILGFLHLEHIYTWPGYPAYHRTGLSISKDGGRTFQWCGYIISPDLSYETWINHWYPENRSCNMGLANYILKDGYFYIYYTDYDDRPYHSEEEPDMGLAVARAKIDEVIAHAEDHKVTVWNKYDGNGWTEKGLGGKFSPLNIEPHDKMHGDAAYNSYLDKYVLVSSRYSEGSAIMISFSSDGISWSDWQVVQKSNRNQNYITIISAGDDNEVIDKSFWIYYRWMREDNSHTFDWARTRVTLN